MKDYFKSAGKTCAISGAYSGMGEATAKLLVEIRADVDTLDPFKPELDGIINWIQIDLADKASIENAFVQLPQHIDCFSGIPGVSGAFNSQFLSDTARDDKNFRNYPGNGKDFARPEALAKAIVYLNSDFAEYYSGLGLIVDYGMEAATHCGQVPDMLGMILV